ncbi:MAG: hypothetical protein BWY69_01178 [Planctomycetes bacterium ADurb.Bin401]|nr:MAG: hypothetical protein BWY69_01178 [Planctomycetes bacterium ADurb.Bin401]
MRFAKTIDVIVWALLIIGGLNWGLVGLFEFNLVAAIFGEMSILSRIIYTLVGFAALYDLFAIKSITRRWGTHDVTPAHA